MADDSNRPGNTGDPKDREEDLLSPYWAIMRRKAGARELPDPTPEERAGKTYPGELVIGTGRGVLVRVQQDGTLIYGDNYTPDEAAVTLWTEIGRRRGDFEARMQYLDLLELHIALLAVSDAAYEAAQRVSRGPSSTDHDRQREELSRASLEMRVHGIIEFAREFANIRPDLVAQARRMVPGAQPATPSIPVEPIQPQTPAPIVEVCTCERVRSVADDGAVVDVIRSPTCQAHGSDPSPTVADSVLCEPPSMIS